MVNVGKYTIHGLFGNECHPYLLRGPVFWGFPRTIIGDFLKSLVQKLGVDKDLLWCSRNDAILYFLLCTVDASEIPRPTTWDIYETMVNNGRNCQPQLVCRIVPSTVVLWTIGLDLFLHLAGASDQHEAPVAWHWKLADHAIYRFGWFCLRYWEEANTRGVYLAMWCSHCNSMLSWWHIFFIEMPLLTIAGEVHQCHTKRWCHQVWACFKIAGPHRVPP